MTNVLVTGGAGYIGSHTCKELARHGYQPVVYDNLSEGHRWAVRYGPLVEGDLADTDRLAAAIRDSGAQAVIHFAAFAYVGESMQDPQKYFRNNVSGTISLLDAMKAAGLGRIVFSSSCATYGYPESVPITEHQRQEPVNPYGASKLFVEQMLRWNAGAYGLRYAALRYFNAAGADADGEIGEVHDPETHLIPLAIQATAPGSPRLQIFGTDYPTPDGTAIRDYVHVTDLARAHLAALRYLEAGGASDAFNLGTGTGTSVREVISAVEAATGRTVAREERPRRPGDPAVLVADASHAGSVLGWRPESSGIAAIVESACRWQMRVDSGEAGHGGGETRMLVPGGG